MRKLRYKIVFVGFKMLKYEGNNIDAAKLECQGEE
jgi:hypothetical protein